MTHNVASTKNICNLQNKRVTEKQKNKFFLSVNNVNEKERKQNSINSPQNKNLIQVRKSYDQQQQIIHQSQNVQNSISFTAQVKSAQQSKSKDKKNNSKQNLKVKKKCEDLQIENTNQTAQLSLSTANIDKCYSPSNQQSSQQTQQQSYQQQQTKLINFLKNMPSSTKSNNMKKSLQIQSLFSSPKNQDNSQLTKFEDYRNFQSSQEGSQKRINSKQFIKKMTQQDYNCLFDLLHKKNKEISQLKDHKDELQNQFAQIKKQVNDIKEEIKQKEQDIQHGSIELKNKLSNKLEERQEAKCKSAEPLQQVNKTQFNQKNKQKQLLQQQLLQTPTNYNSMNNKTNSLSYMQKTGVTNSSLFKFNFKELQKSMQKHSQEGTFQDQMTKLLQNQQSKDQIQIIKSRNQQKKNVIQLAAQLQSKTPQQSQQKLNESIKKSDVNNKQIINQTQKNKYIHQKQNSLLSEKKFSSSEQIVLDNELSASKVGEQRYYPSINSQQSYQQQLTQSQPGEEEYQDLEQLNPERNAEIGMSLHEFSENFSRSDQQNQTDIIKNLNNLKVKIISALQKYKSKQSKLNNLNWNLMKKISSVNF